MSETEVVTTEENASVNSGNKVDSKAVTVYVALGVEFTKAHRRKDQTKYKSQRQNSWEGIQRKLKNSGLRTELGVNLMSLLTGYDKWLKYWADVSNKPETLTALTSVEAALTKEGEELEEISKKLSSKKASLLRSIQQFIKYNSNCEEISLSGIPGEDDKLLGDLQLKENKKDSEYEYRNKVKKCKFTIHLVEEKAAFKKALEEADVHVIYQGHSREGRGACFGTTDNVGSDWENETDDKHGIFRMGYPLLGVPVEDLFEHQCALKLFYSDETMPKDNDDRLHPAVKKAHANVLPVKRVTSKPSGATEEKWGCWKIASEKIEVFVQNYSSSLPAKRPFPTSKPRWVYPATHPGEKNEILWMVMHGGWNDKKKYDLGATALNCGVFCNFACSSFDHFSGILKEKKKLHKEKVKTKFALLTDSTVGTECSAVWLWALLNTSDGQNTEVSLNNVVKKANEKLESLSDEHKWMSKYNIKLMKLET